jgi:hypothetical protein
MCQKNPDDERAILFKMKHIIECFIGNHSKVYSNSHLNCLCNFRVKR